MGHICCSYCSSGERGYLRLCPSRAPFHLLRYNHFPETPFLVSGPDVAKTREKRPWQTYRANIPVYDILRVDVRERTRSLIHYIQTICARMEANVIEDVPVAIIGSRDGGYGMPRPSHGGRPSGRNVFVVITDNRPVILKCVDHL